MTFGFSEHAVLLAGFLDRHPQIVARVESRLLNVQGKPLGTGAERERVSQALDACFFEEAGTETARLKGQLAAMHRADGFVAVGDGTADTGDPASLIVRAYGHWERHRWPGRSGRIAYARSIFAAFMLRRLEHMSLRIWTPDGSAADRLQEIQRLLDRLNEVARPIVLVRDARWLMQTAQGALTRDIGPYFRVAGLIAGSFPAQAGLAIHEAGAKLAGGHLRSQLWYRSRETGHAIDHPDVLSVTRNSNSMDTALLVRDLVPLLEAYDVARSTGDAGKRLRLADAIVQGVSADPELFLTRLDLLPAFTAIEHLFVDGTGYTALGEEQGGLLNRYSDLIRRVAAALVGDAPGFAPGRGTYSPFGLTYGFCADLLSRMALRPLVSQDALHFSLEDVFNHGPSNERPPALSAAGWADLPNWHGHQPIEYSADWADVMFERTMRGLHARAMNPAPNASSVATGRLFVVPETLSTEDLPAGFLPEGIVPAQEHLVTSDVAHALASGATAFPRSQIASDRREGRFLASAELGGRWFGVSKVVLTACIGQGKDALITGAPAPLLDVLRLTCGEIVKLPASGCQPPAPDF